MKLEEVFKICHEGVAGGHRGVAGTLDKFQRTFFAMSASWSGKMFKTMFTLILLLTSVMKVEGNTDWRESPFSMQAFDCTTPTMINKMHLPKDCFIPRKKMPEKLAVSKDAWILGEEYVHELSSVVCTATISRFKGYCGAYLHWKFMDVPEVGGGMSLLPWSSAWQRRRAFIIPRMVRK